MLTVALRSTCMRILSTSSSVTRGKMEESAPLQKSSMSPGHKHTHTQMHSMVSAEGREVMTDINQSGIFMLQTISINGKELLIFYDSGCMGAAVSERACAAL